MTIELKQRREQFRQVYGRLQGKVYSICYSVTKNKALAQDATQDTWASVWEKWGQCRDIDTVAYWIQAIARNKSINALHKERKHPLGAIEPCDLVEPETPDNLEAARRRLNTTNRALAAMPRTHSQAYLLRSVRGLSYDEIASLVGVPVNTIRTRIYRARQKLGL